MQKAWNIPNLPVYSLATYSQERLNMNICTYVSSISMQPKLYGIAIYNHTQTLANLEQSDLAVLQLLHKSQYNLVHKLGKTNGFNYNKHQYLQKKNALTIWQNFEVLQDCSALILLKKLQGLQTGDHHFFVFEVLKSKVFNKEYLQLDTLREKKIIRG